MIAYFYAHISKKIAPPEEFIKIVSILKEFGITVVTNIDDPKEWEIHQEVVRQVKESGQTMLSKIDLLIIEATNQDPEVSYLVAQAAMYKKPTLCLHRHSKQRHNVINHLSTKPNLEFLQVKSYTINTIERVLLQFLKTTDAIDKQDEIPSIKYTLRISPKHERFLEWKSGQEGRTKSKYLRRLIQEELDASQDYKTHLEDHI